MKQLCFIAVKDGFMKKLFLNIIELDLVTAYSLNKITTVEYG
jgi:hypothetical protein